MSKEPADPEVYRRRCANCGHTERLHLWSKSIHPNSKK
jgi:formate dehydrogenase maturation protein FdhE